MKTQSLQSFIALAGTLHFARAAVQLGMGQATLSQQISGLEAEIGAQLFQRDNRNVCLTPAGEAFLTDAQAAVALLNAAAVRARFIARGEVGELRVGATSAALLELMPAVLETLAQQYPSLTLRVQEHSSMVQEQMLLAGELDVGVLHTPIVAGGLRHDSLGDEPMCLALWDEHPLTELNEIPIAQLDGERLLIPLRNSAPLLVGRIEALLATAGCEVHMEEQHCAPATLLALVAARRGLAFVPGQSRHMRRPNVVIRRLLGAPLELGLATAWIDGDKRATVHTFVRTARLASLSTAST